MREIRHVNIKQDGEVLADVDAFSTREGMAYYLWSRRLEDGTEDQILDRIRLALPGQPDTARVVRETRDPLTRNLISCLVAEIGP
jgi:hypothetical protein